MVVWNAVKAIAFGAVFVLLAGTAVMQWWEVNDTHKTSKAVNVMFACLWTFLATLYAFVMLASAVGDA